MQWFITAPGPFPYFYDFFSPFFFIFKVILHLYFLKIYIRWHKVSHIKTFCQRLNPVSIIKDLVIVTISILLLSIYLSWSLEKSSSFFFHPCTAIIVIWLNIYNGVYHERWKFSMIFKFEDFQPPSMIPLRGGSTTWRLVLSTVYAIPCLQTAAGLRGVKGAQKGVKSPNRDHLLYL